jgi:hypothetical protein
MMQTAAALATTQHFIQLALRHAASEISRELQHASSHDAISLM